MSDDATIPAPDPTILEPDAGSVTPQELGAPLEALLLMADEAMPTESLAEAVGAPTDLVLAALRELATFYDQTGRGFELRHVGGGWRYWTRAEHHELLSQWVVSGQQNKLTQAALETLSVIAYLQPISRARVSAVRGVNVDGVVRTLLARDLVSESGIDEQTGATLFATTDYFLERMGIASVDELPPLAPNLPDATALEEELAQLAAQPPLPPGTLPSATTDGVTGSNAGDSSMARDNGPTGGDEPDDDQARDQARDQDRDHDE
ncbi:SMC-Scp complex subunit ScpB [Luteococcus sanguinis]|uniref:SMC-Scp complex subunit ScpB n=1 Tax=Luteococcus sanguinis TaxID=174038 RepID=A0ABW1X0N6_9ACTN